MVKALSFEITKNRERKEFSFANINLLGKCNVDCYFCLGKDIPELLSKHNQLQVPFSEWKNFEKFISRCVDLNITKLYITGQNTDSLLYAYLDELVETLQTIGFTVGLRTNGYLAKQKIITINKCLNSTGYSIHTLNPETNMKIMGRKDLPDWRHIIPFTQRPRVSIVINRYNVNEFFNIMAYLSRFKNIRYVQVRRVSTDKRIEELMPDIVEYERLFFFVNRHFPMKKKFYDAEVYTIYNMETVFWRTVQTSVNSINYFTDGTISEEYFVIEGYLKNYEKA